MSFPSEKDRYDQLCIETIRAVQHEREINRAYERHCPSARPSEEYLRGPLPATQFYTTEEYATYRVQFERRKFYPSKRR